MKHICLALITVALINHPVTVYTSAPHKITILFSASDNGYIYGCCCPSSPKSGVIKRAGFIQSYREKVPDAVIVSTGDIFSVYPDAKRSAVAAKAQSLVGYQAIVPGDQEFVNGIDFFISLGKMLPLTAANLTVNHADAGEVINPYILVNYGVLKVAFIGIIDPDAFKYFQDKDALSKITIGNPAGALTKIYTEVKTKADFIIILSHGGVDFNKKLAKACPWPDIFIGGHTQELVKEPIKDAVVPVIQPGKNGDWQGELILTKKNSDNKQINHSLTYHFFRHPCPPKIKISETIILGDEPFSEYSAKIHENPPDHPGIASLCKNENCY